jgi:FixJ family two-component response regulator
MNCNGCRSMREAPDLPTVVHVVDDDASFRVAMGRLLRASGYETVLHESAKLLLDRLPDGRSAGCILLDVKMPELSGPELQTRLMEAGSKMPIVFLTGNGDIPTSVRAIKAGAEDFLTKPIEKDRLFGAIERAIARYQSARQENDRLNTLRARIATPTPREEHVFELVVRGKPNKQIAYELSISESTTKIHRGRVMAKAQVQSFAELVSIAERNGVLASPPIDR